MNREEMLFEIERLESRKLACASEMSASDAYASKCSKLGISFAETYPDELERYRAANAEYNECDARIQELKSQLPELIPEEGAHIPVDGVESNE